MAIAPILSQDVPVFGYRINIGQALTTVLALSAVTIYLVRKICFRAEQNKSLSSDKTFWNTVEKFPTVTNESDPVVIGNTTFSNLAAAQKEMVVSCTKISDYVKKYLVQSRFKGTVLDLGCGIGANALPLVAKGCHVTIIDRQEDAIMAYNGKEMYLFLRNMFSCDGLQQAQSIVGDITEHAYPENIDAVICVDTLPYIRPSKVKRTMDKIFQALRPGGQFVGTIFFKPKKANGPFVEVMGKLGAHFYPDKDFAREIITRSGFQITKETERRDRGFFSHSHCLEFLAVKPY